MSKDKSMLENIFHLDVSIKIFDETKYISLGSLVKLDFSVARQDISEKKIIFLVLRKETLVTYILKDERNIEKILENFQEIITVLCNIHKNNIFDEFEKHFLHTKGKYYGFFTFQNPDKLNEIINIH